jgi:hypothetical protein
MIMQSLGGENIAIWASCFIICPHLWRDPQTVECCDVRWVFNGEQ